MPYYLFYPIIVNYSNFWSIFSVWKYF